MEEIGEHGNEAHRPWPGPNSTRVDGVEDVQEHRRRCTKIYLIFTELFPYARNDSLDTFITDIEELARGPNRSDFEANVGNLTLGPFLDNTTPELFLSTYPFGTKVQVSQLL